MAAQHANQFIGSKISLISKSEIRYEGILYSLDLQDATISLAKVKSFGTEDRPTQIPVAVKDDIYEFVIFRGSDIKGIDVLEPPKAAPTLTSGLPNDPAIIEVSHYSSSSQSGQAAGPAVPPTSELQGGISVVQGDSNAGSAHEASRSNASTPSLYSRKSPTNDAGTQSNEDKRARQYRQSEGRGSRPTSQDRRRLSRGNDQRGGYQPRGRGNFVPRGGFRGGRGGPRGGGFRNQGSMQAQQPAKVTFDEEFDFEKENEEFQALFSKLKLQSESAEKKEGEANGENDVEAEEPENKEPAEPYYVKDSFFDKISCESTERSKGKNTRPDWKAERKLNAETFGLPQGQGPRRPGYQRGGGYRGYRGGYGGQQRGGYHHGGRGGYYSGGYDGGYRNNGGYYNNYNRYNGRGGNRGGYRQQQSQQPQQEQAAQ